MSHHVTGGPLRVLIAGGGVAGLEAALALHELAGERVSMTLLAPESEFVYRPLVVREPFARPPAQRYPLEAVTADIGVHHARDAFRWLEPSARTVHTDGGERLPYDALLLALGARSHPCFRHALTLDVRRLDEQLHGLIQDVEYGYVTKLAFIVPNRLSWPLPAYELALMTAHRAWDMNMEVTIAVVTPEEAPLAIFGRRVAAAVSRRLYDSGIQAICSTHASTPQAGRVVLHPGNRLVDVDRVIALPELFGPPTPGVPKRDAYGFIPIDSRCRVPGLHNVFAAGDATEFPIKHGGLAAQQADVAAASIAALAGADVEPTPLHPTLQGVLLGGGRPLYMSARVTGSWGTDSQISQEPLWSPSTKIVARHLGPRLDALDHAPVV